MAITTARKTGSEKGIQKQLDEWRLFNEYSIKSNDFLQIQSESSILNFFVHLFQYAVGRFGIIPC